MPTDTCTATPTGTPTPISIATLSPTPVLAFDWNGDQRLTAADLIALTRQADQAYEDDLAATIAALFGD